MPNLPTEDEIKLEGLAMNIVHQIGDALYEALPKDVAHEHFVTARQATNDIAIDFAAELIHHYATKREVEARIDEADKIYTNADDLACHGGSTSSIIRSIAGRKRALEAQKEQENDNG